MTARRSLLVCTVALASVACGDSIPAGPNALVDTDWLVVRLDPSATVAGAPVTRPHLSFGRPGARAGFSAWIGCNFASGRYAIAGDVIAFSEVMSTLMACQQGSADLEGALFGVFARARHWRVENGLLVLQDGARAEIAAFAPYPSAFDATP